MLISFLVFVFCLFLVLFAYLLATRSSDAKRTRLQQRLSEALLNSAHSKDEQPLIDEAIDKSLAIIPQLCAGKFETAMMQLHTSK